MPYIKQEDRNRFIKLVEMIDVQEIKSAGELNYLLTIMAHRFLNQKPENYQSYNDAIGALEGCKLELYRRHVGEYEDVKVRENGDV